MRGNFRQGRLVGGLARSVVWAVSGMLLSAAAMTAADVTPSVSMRPSSVLRVSAPTPDEPASVPGQPATVTATAKTTSAIRLDWTPPTDSGTGPITGYVITRPGKTPLSVAASDRARTLTYLDPGTSYTFTVAAINATGTGPGRDAPHHQGRSRARAARDRDCDGEDDLGDPVGLDPAGRHRDRTDHRVRHHQAWQDPAERPASDRARTLTYLDPGTSYTFTVAAINATGTGPAARPPQRPAAVACPASPRP